MAGGRKNTKRYYVGFSPSPELQSRLKEFLQDPGETPILETTTQATMLASGLAEREHEIFADWVNAHLGGNLSRLAIGLSGAVGIVPVEAKAAYRLYLPVHPSHQRDLDQISDAMRSIPGHETEASRTGLYWQVARSGLVRATQLAEARDHLAASLREPNAHRVMRAVNPRLMREDVSK